MFNAFHNLKRGKRPSVKIFPMEIDRSFNSQCVCHRVTSYTHRQYSRALGKPSLAEKVQEQAGAFAETFNVLKLLTSGFPQHNGASWDFSVEIFHMISNIYYCKKTNIRYSRKTNSFNVILDLIYLPTFR